MSEQNNPYGAPTTGHLWDDNLAELTNQPPKWWMIGLHASWILVLLYGIVYPMWPWFGGATQGLMGWTQIGEYKQDMAAIQSVRAQYEDKLPGMSASAILADSELSEYVVRSAKVLFGDNCAACHGGGGQGNPGYPNLVDDDWLYGGDIDTLVATVTNGRMGMMPAKAGVAMTEAEIDQLAAAVAKGEPTSSPLFMEKACFACHGMDGKGMHALGAPNLTDAIWRFGDGSAESVKYTITHGVNDPADPQTRNAVMPKFGDRLNETDIKKLAVYVSKLGAN